MKIGVIADTHDRLDYLRRALAVFAAEPVEAVVHAGDLIAPFAAKLLVTCHCPITVVYGNNDGERAGLAKVLPGIADGPVLAEIGGRRISVDHTPPGEPNAPAEGAEVVVFGHTHEATCEFRDGVLYLNPGECGGWLHGTSSVAILDTDTLTARVVALD